MGKVSDDYGLKTLAPIQFAKDETIEIPDKVKTKITAKTGYIELGDNTSGGKTIEKNAELSFTIKYRSGLTDKTKPSKVTLGDKNFTDKCTVKDATTLACTIPKDTLSTEGTFDVIITNACAEVEETGIKITVGGSSPSPTPASSSIAAFSKITLLIAGLLFL